MAEFQYDMSENYRQFRWPWKKIFICFLGAVLVLVGTFFGGYFRGIEVGKLNHKHDEAAPVSEKLTRPSWKKENCSAFSGHCPNGFSSPPLILISLDGFRPAYFELNVTPSLQRLIQCGTFSKMRPVFPSKTFPNHYTIVTGLYPESHGIVDNKMIDPESKAMFQIGNNETFNDYWWEGEPIWVTAEKQGIKTGTVFWPGSDVIIKGIRPTYFLVYNDKLSWECRVDTILSWLDLPSSSRPSFFTLYVNEPDNTAHKHGPESNEVKKALRRVDIMINRLMKGLRERNLLGCINILITSDHGMSSTSCERVFALDKYVNISSVTYIVGATSRLRPKDSSQVAVDSLIEALSCQEKSILASHKDKLPIRYHYSQNPRIEPIVLDMEPGWLTFRSAPEEGKLNYCNGGAHGYDNMVSEMQAIFLASGPSFKQGLTTDPFLNVEVYNLMAELLNITALPNNGTRGRLHRILKHPLPISPLPEILPNGACNHFEENNNVDTGCICDQQMAVNILNYDANFKVHLPWGSPKTKSIEADSVCLLKNRDYISGFHKGLKLPIWTAFTINMASITNTKSSSCWMADPRIPITDSLTCFNFAESEWNYVTPQPVFPSEFASSEDGQTLSRILTNVVPKFNFSLTIDNYLHNLIVNYVKQYGSVNIVTGPVFAKKTNLEKNTHDDKNSHNQQFPTHYFTVITYCSQKDIAIHICSSSDLDVIAFLLPNEAFSTKCQDYSQYLVYHSASVKDVQSVTGLQFYSELLPYEVIRLQTRLPTES